MGHIRQRKLKCGKVRFQGEVRLKGHRTITAVFDRKKDCQTWINKIETEIRCGRYQLYSEAKRHTLKEAIDRYMKELKISVVKRGHLLWWQKELGHLYLQDIRPSIIVEKKQKLLTQSNNKGIVRSGSTCNRFLATLSHLMSVCEKQWEWIENNPVKKISREKEPRERTRVLSDEERQRLLQACKESTNPYLFAFVVLQLSTGGRYNEVRCLRWTDIDLVNGRVIFMKTKNDDIRSVPVRGLALDLLRKLSMEQKSLGYIFPSKDRTRPLDLRKAFRTAIKKANLKDYRGHDNRHFYASAMLAQGLSLGEIGHLLGHRSVSMTRRYAHLVESRSIDAIEQMSNEVFKEIKSGV